MLMRALLAFIALPAMVAGAIPYALSRLPAPHLFRTRGAYVAIGIGARAAAAVTSH